MVGKHLQWGPLGRCEAGGGGGEWGGWGGTGNGDFLGRIFGYRHVLRPACYNATNFQMVQKRETERWIEQM